ncbi:hypothetical protein PBRA_007700, partial [Plasmodiophora brassicae]
MEALVRSQISDAVDRNDAPALERILKEQVECQRQTRTEGMLSNAALVIAAEAAIKLGLVERAERCLHEFHLNDPRQDQFLARARLVEAQIAYSRARGLKDQSLLQQVQAAIASVSSALAIALRNKRRVVVYAFLIYNCSVVYWTIARCLFRPNMRKHATPSLQAITDAMMKNAKDQIPKDWLVEFVIALATCCDDAGDAAGAGKNANDALALVKDLPRSTQIRVIRLCVHVNRGKGSIPSIALPLTSLKAIVAVQSVLSGMVKPDQVAGKLREALQAVDQDPRTEPKQLDLNKLDVVGEISRVAFHFGALDVAQACIDHSLFCKSFAGLRKAWMLAELTGAEVTIQAKEANARRALPDVRLSCLKSITQTLDGSLRSRDVDLIHDVAATIWNMALPLFRDQYRHEIHSYLRKCTDALCLVDSPLYDLRVQFHYELALCELADDDQAKARRELDAAALLDGSIPVDQLPAELRGLPNVAEFQRPLDRYIVPLRKRLQLCAGAAGDPAEGEDRAVLLVEHSSEVKDRRAKRRLLLAAARQVDLCPEGD